MFNWDLLKRKGDYIHDPYAAELLRWPWIRETFTRRNTSTEDLKTRTKNDSEILWSLVKNKSNIHKQLIC